MGGSDRELLWPFWLTVLWPRLALSFYQGAMVLVLSSKALSLNNNEIFNLKPVDSNRSAPLPEVISAITLFTEVLDLEGWSRRRFYEVLKMSATEETEKAQLQHIFLTGRCLRVRSTAFASRLWHARQAISFTLVESADALPAAADRSIVCGTVTKGSRLAFDLGKTGIKTVAVKDGEVLFSQETKWMSSLGPTVPL